MSSLARYANSAVKIPAGRKFFAQPDQQFLSVLDCEPYCFQKSDIDALLSPGFIRVADDLYSAKTSDDLSGVLNTLNNLSEYEFDCEEYTAIDLGKTLRIGLFGGDNDIITMRLVKRTGTVESLGSPVDYPNVCYIVTGNRMGTLYNNSLYCCVLGTSPNNRTRKPFLNFIDKSALIVSVPVFESILSSTLNISKTLYLARDTTEFSGLLDAFGDSSNYTQFESNELSAIDIGKSVRIGIVGGENDLLVFRLVKRTGTVSTLGEPNNVPNVGYVCLTSKVNRTDPEGAAEPQFTGTSPNALEIKPQFISNYSFEPYMFPETDIRSILADCIKVSNTLYLARDATQLSSVCTTLNDLSGRDYLQYDAMSSIDTGKTIRLGIVGGENDLITFASTRGETHQHPGVQTTAFVVVGNKLSQDYNDALYISISGSAPRNSYL